MLSTFLALRPQRCKHSPCLRLLTVFEEQKQPNGEQLKKEETEVALMFNVRESLEEKRSRHKKEKNVLKVKLVKILPRYKYLRYHWYPRHPHHLNRQ